MRTWPAARLSGLGAAAPADLVEAVLVNHDVAAIEELPDGSRRVYFTSSGERDSAMAALGREYPLLHIQPVEIPDDDWAARSQAALRHIRIGGLTVAPPWDVPAPDSEPAFPASRTVVIQPSMGFGTGHHATTRLCLAALQEFDLSGRSVLDIGTGSGVLAIAASLLGAGSSTGIDDDADAIQAARENLRLNAGAQVAFHIVDLRQTDMSPADVVVANLTGALLVQAADRIAGLVVDGGTLVLSGLLADEEGDVCRAFRSFDVRRRVQEDEWLCLTLRHNSG